MSDQPTIEFKLNSEELFKPLGLSPDKAADVWLSLRQERVESVFGVKGLPEAEEKLYNLLTRRLVLHTELFCSIDADEKPRAQND